LTAPSFTLLPLGGCGEFGANATLLFAGDAESSPAILIEAGARFAGAGLPGIDLVLPDLDFLERLGDRLLGCLVTHGHEDHIAALPYLLRRRSLPVYAPDYCLRQLRARLDAAGLSAVPRHALAPGLEVELGPFQVEPVAVSHSIPETVALAVRVNGARALFSSDFRIDRDPVWGWATDTERLFALGEEGVTALIADSTGALSDGDNPGERAVRQPLAEAISSAPGRVVVTTFPSHASRVRQLLEIARSSGRRVALAGRSAKEHVALARAAGVLEVPPGLLIDADRAADISPQELMVIATGCQGERRAALPRMAAGARELPPVERGDRVIYSARVIPGNEEAVQRVANELIRRGAEIIWGDSGVHVSGHGYRGDLRHLLELTRPALFVPAHGDTVHLRAHAALAEEAGLAPEQIAWIEDGQPLEVHRDGGRWQGRIAPPFTLCPVMIEEGREVADGDTLVSERRRAALHGVLCAAIGPAANSGGGNRVQLRGHGVDVHGLTAVLDEARAEAEACLARLPAEELDDTEAMEGAVRAALRRVFRRRGVHAPQMVVIGPPAPGA